MDSVGSRPAGNRPALPNPTAGGTVMAVDTPHPASPLSGKGNWLRDAGFLGCRWCSYTYAQPVAFRGWSGRWFVWAVEPSNGIAPSDWFLRHLEVVCIAASAVRVLAQMTVTAPFYAGIGYSLGALCGKLQVLKKIFPFEKPSDEGSESESSAADAASHDHDTSC
jgi:hypothetical protein